MRALLIFVFLALPVLAAAQSTPFQPLTNLPGLTQTVSAESLPAFFNNLYKLCIGAAAVIAILQIMRAGTKFFFNKGSVAQNEEGKHLIQNSILGLLLVLSPYIVFGIINPDILDLKLNVDGLRVAPLTEADSWLRTCGITVDAETRSALQSGPASARQFYEQCVAQRRGTQAACVDAAQNVLALHLRLYNVPVDRGQLECIDGQVLSAIGVTEEQARPLQCSLYTNMAWVDRQNVLPQVYRVPVGDIVVGIPLSCAGGATRGGVAGCVAGSAATVGGVAQGAETQQGSGFLPFLDIVFTRSEDPNSNLTPLNNYCCQERLGNVPRADNQYSCFGTAMANQYVLVRYRIGSITRYNRELHQWSPWEACKTGSISRYPTEQACRTGLDVARGMENAPGQGSTYRITYNGREIMQKECVQVPSSYSLPAAPAEVANLPDCQ